MLVSQPIYKYDCILKLVSGQGELEWLCLVFYFSTYFDFSTIIKLETLKMMVVDYCAYRQMEGAFVRSNMVLP